MIEIVKKTFLTGAGLAHKTWDEVEALTKDIVKKAKMGEKEGSKFLKDMKSRYDDTQKRTGKYVEKVVKDILKKMDVATASDIKALKREIQQLKKATGSTAAKKRAGRTTVKKRTATAAKKRTTTVARKRAATTRAKKTSSRASATKRSSRAATPKR
ncbi:MAG: phasin family protein [Desulfobacterales bacterium]|jgi:polyhydroxyalkanoate synthesis regulator phasin